MFIKKKNFLNNSSGMSLISTMVAVGLLGVTIMVSSSFYEIIVKLYQKASILRSIDKKSEYLYSLLADYALCQANFQGQTLLDGSADKTQTINSSKIQGTTGYVVEDFSIPFERTTTISSVYINNFRRTMNLPSNELGVADLNFEFSYRFAGVTHTSRITKLIFVEKFNNLINTCGTNLDFNSHWMWKESMANTIYYPGKVGINTNSPAYTLDIIGNSVLNITGGYAQIDGGVRFVSSGSNVRLDSTEGGYFAFATYSATGRRLFASFNEKMRWSNYFGGPGQYQAYYDGGKYLMMTFNNAADEYWKFYVYRNNPLGSGVSNAVQIVGETPSSIFRVRSNVNLFEKSTGGERFYVSGTAGGPSSWNSLSDMRNKKDFKKVADVDKKLDAINEYQFEFKNDKQARTHLGYVAQEVQKVLPEVVDKSGGYLKLDYGSINGLLIEKLKRMEKDNQETQKDFLAAKNKICNKYKGLKSCRSQK